jgi:hypothetical protein
LENIEMDNEIIYQIGLRHTTDLITRAFQQMTLAQTEELVRIKREGMSLAMNANLSAQIDHDMESHEVVRDIIGRCLAKTRRGEQ